MLRLVFVLLEEYICESSEHTGGILRGNSYLGDMVSQTRSASSRGASNLSGNKTRSTRSTTQRNAASRHAGGGTHRSKGNGPKQKGRKKHLLLKWILGIIGAIIVLGVAAFAYLYITTEIPQPEKIAMSQKTTVYYSDGTTEMGSFADQNREIIDCSVLPKYVGQAIVASENRTFYTDSGIDLKGIARAFFNNVTTGSRQGGSTITQQYAERYYLGETTSYLGKAHEAILALKIAQTQDKDTVLCNYMNTIYLGRGAYGIQAAAKAYFNKDAKDLTISEAAMLAGIIPAPSSWDPAINLEQATSRFNRVINIMKEDGYITSDEASQAAMPETVANTQEDVYSGPKGYLLQMVRDELTSSGSFTEDDLDTGGYKIVTTIDKAKQDLMFQVASPSQGGADVVPDGLQIGSMSVNPKDGSMISLYAGDDYLTKQLNNATQARYEPGSTMKPFALLATVQQGVSLETTFNGNSPQSFTGISSPVQNFGNQSYGYINLSTATAYSVNTVYMALQEKLGAAKVAETAVTAGMDADHVTGDNPFTVLGNDSVHVSEVARAYATIANNGNKPTLHIVSSVTNSENKELYQAPTSTESVFTQNDTSLVEKAMTGTIQYGTATEARSVGKTMAGKSGTANDSTAGSFVGFTPNTVTVFAMWYPDADGNPQEIPSFSGYSGGSDYPIHLFTEYMKQALADTADEAFPTPTDTGKIGGTDGTWGTGSRSSSTQQQTPRQESQDTEQQNSTQQNSGSGSGSGDGSSDSDSNGTTPESGNGTPTDGTSGSNGSGNSGGTDGSTNTDTSGGQ